MSDIIERIEREVGTPGLVEILADRLSPTDLQSVLLEVYRQRASQRSASEILLDYESDRLVRPGNVSPLRLAQWEATAWAALPSDFQHVALSPIAPLGTCSVVGSVTQDWSVAAIRNVEVVSDSTNALALECALQRRRLLQASPRSAEPVHMAASHRLLRPQRYADPKATAHFSLFALCSAGRDTGNLRFERENLAQHIRFHMTILRAFLGAETSLWVRISDFAASTRQELLETDLLEPLRAEFAGVKCDFDQARTGGHGYYRDLCFHIYVVPPSGDPIQIADGGSVDWTQKYLSNSKERLIISGIGSERVCGLLGSG